jgi:hypothetical protein
MCCQFHHFHGKTKACYSRLFRVVGSLLTITFQNIFLHDVILHESGGLLLMQWGWIQSIFMHKILRAEELHTDCFINLQFGADIIKLSKCARHLLRLLCRFLDQEGFLCCNYCPMPSPSIPAQLQQMPAPWSLGHT